MNPVPVKFLMDTLMAVEEAVFTKYTLLPINIKFAELKML